MRRLTSLIALACAVALAAVAVSTVGLPSAMAAGGNTIINDCEANGVLTHNYTVAELQHALAVMSASTKQYTDCPDVIEHALQQRKRTGGAAGTGTSGGSGGSFLPTPVIVILVVLILAAATFGAIAFRRRQGDDDEPGERGDEPGGPGEPGDPAGSDSP